MDKYVVASGLLDHTKKEYTLKADVNAYIDDGYIPNGSIVAIKENGTYTLIQPMIKKETKCSS